MSDLCTGISQSANELSSSQENLETVKVELQRVSEQSYITLMALKGVKSDLAGLRQNMEVATKNSGALQVTLAKLKSRIETHRHRTSGAVCTIDRFQIMWLL
jgi:chromosome segregation ATPase